MALDSKVILDDNALFRHPELIKYEEATELKLLPKRMDFHLYNSREIPQLLVTVQD